MALLYYFYSQIRDMVKWMSLLILILFVYCPKTFSQYYYKDILSNQQTIAERNLLKTQRIKLVKVHSLEADGKASAGFFCEKKISKDYLKIETFTKSNISGKSVLTAIYNEAGQLIQSEDSSETVVSYSDYKYDSNNNLISILSRSHSFDDDFATILTEEKLYLYNDKNQPITLLLIKNKKDTTQFNFTLDEKGNVTDEIEKTKTSNHYYYYYNALNKLSDIVRFSTIKGKLLPDFLFDYNEAGQMSQMVNTEEGPTSDYFTWKYFYNDTGLRIVEKCYSKEKDLLGSFEYEYE